MGNLQHFLDTKFLQYNHPDFIKNDPVSVPHRFSSPLDCEVAGLFAAILAWGQRKTIIAKTLEIMDRMDGQPYAFIRQHSEHDLKALIGFRHRTFCDTDLLYFVHFLRWYYSQYPSLEIAFAVDSQSPTIEQGLNRFRRLFASLPECPPRTLKHVSSPETGSACKRLCMYLRWMVRNDGRGVDFGIWKTLSAKQLVCPLDIHVSRVAVRLGLLDARLSGWRAAIALTDNLRRLDPDDPVRYDFALFGLGMEAKLLSA